MRQMLTIYWSRPGEACCKCWNMLGQSAPAKCWNNMFHTTVDPYSARPASARARRSMLGARSIKGQNDQAHAPLPDPGTSVAPPSPENAKTHSLTHTYNTVSISSCAAPTAP